MLVAEESPKVEYRIKSDAVKANGGGGALLFQILLCKLSFPAHFPCLSSLLSLNRKEKISCPVNFNFEAIFFFE